jgi:GTPase
VRSGFVTLVGRPNVGKSTLLNHILGTKVTITSDKPQTTRTQVRGILNLRPDPPGTAAQVVFVDTPGIHKPRTLMGERLNDTATSSIGDVDVTVIVLDATQPIGRGDGFVARRVPPSGIVAVNKIDACRPHELLKQLETAGRFELSAYYPVSAKTGEGVAELVSAVVDRLPEGPALYPTDVVTDVPDAVWVAELVREQLLAVTHDEVPHSIACRVTEWEWPRVRCEITVERESQKGIVIGKGGVVLKMVGTRVREQLPSEVYLELFVKVDPRWQQEPAALDRLGY